MIYHVYDCTPLPWLIISEINMKPSSIHLIFKSYFSNFFLDYLAWVNRLPKKKKENDSINTSLEGVLG